MGTIAILFMVLTLWLQFGADSARRWVRRQNHPSMHNVGIRQECEQCRNCRHDNAERP